MQNKHLKKSFILTIVCVLLFFTAWELYLRQKGINISYDDGKELWSDKRAMVYEPADEATVFIGSSRNKYDLDIATWQSQTGNHAIQLAIEGNSPLPVLDDLANDKKFKGNLIVDVTEILFFSTSPRNTSTPKERIEYYKKRTPAERFSFGVNHFIESKLVFLDKNNFSLNVLLDKIPVKKRKGVFALPCECPMDFGRVTFDRQNVMTDKFLSDSNLQNQVKGLWDFYRKMGPPIPPPGPGLDSFLTVARNQQDSILATVKTAVDKIKARGGKIIFVRTPSSGPFLMGEKMGFPRQQCWDKLLAVTNCTGIYFEDYPAIAHFQCPEFSHLKQADAVIFTKNLILILEEKGWIIKNNKNSYSKN
ncbi:hypothetical protein BH09BAC2_BH09BAC2_00290 [soil metagenome]